MEKLVKGWGINDSEYRTSIKTDYYVNGKRKYKTVWVCPFYAKWLSVLNRAHSEIYKINKPTYSDVYCSEEWKYFSKFKYWMEKQNWEGLELDKDILIKGNKEYGPDACVFVPRYINLCINIRGNEDSDLPVGVTRKSKDRRMINPHNDPFIARISSGVRGVNLSLGNFNTAQQAHKAWQEAKIISLENTLNRYAKDACYNSKVADAIMNRVWQLRLDILNGKETKHL